MIPSRSSFSVPSSGILSSASFILIIPLYPGSPGNLERITAGCDAVAVAVAEAPLVLIGEEDITLPGICPGKEDGFLYEPPLKVQYATVAKEVLLQIVSIEPIVSIVFLFLLIKAPILISVSSFNSNLSLLNMVRLPSAVFLSDIVNIPPI